MVNTTKTEVKLMSNVKDSPVYIKEYIERFYKDPVTNKNVLSCTDRDSNGMTMPAIEDFEKTVWMIDGLKNRYDKDPTTGYLLPTMVIKYVDGDNLYYYVDDKLSRTEVDIDGNLLPAVTLKNGSKQYWIDGVEIKMRYKIITEYTLPNGEVRFISKEVPKWKILDAL